MIVGTIVVKSHLMGDRKYWIQLALSILVPFVTGAGLLQIKEHLPKWLFLLFLSVLCTFIIVVLLRLAFGDWFGRVWVWWKKRTEYKQRCRMALNWRQRFIALADIIVVAANKDWGADKDESDKYTAQRRWFIRNRSELLPMWVNFMRRRIDSDPISDTGTLEYEIIHGHYHDPFSFFYDPLTLSRVGATLSISVGDNDPDKVRYLLARLHDLIAEFVHWVEYEYKRYS